MFPGVVSAPFAAVKLGPDVSSGNIDAYSGYLPQGNITGFSLMHQSGTGGAPKYGVVSQMPVVGNISDPLGDLSSSRSAPDQAEVGRYKSFLSGDASVELAATEHAGMFMYQFPESSAANVVVDVSHFLTSYRGLGIEQHYVNGSISFATDSSGHTYYQGFGTYNNGWNLGKCAACSFLNPC